MKKYSIWIVGVLLVMSLAAGCSKPAAPVAQDAAKITPAASNPVQSTTADKIEHSWKGKLYFSDNNAMYLIGEEREMKSVTDGTDKLDLAAKAKIMLEELIKGPKTKDLVASVPKNTKVRSVILEKDTMVVDLSKEFVDGNPGGSTGEIMALGPIVLTLTDLEGVKQVSIRIEGKIQPDYKGHMALDKPFKRAEFEQFLGK